MTEHIIEQLDDYVDGVLSTTEAEPIREHIANCAECARAEQKLRSLLSAAAALPQSIEPPAEVWAYVQARTTARPARAATLWSFRYPLAAAAVVLIIASSTITALLLKTTAPSSAPTSASNSVSLVALEAADREYARIALELERNLNSRAAEIDPATIKVVRENLVIIDHAIADARAALEKSPGNTELSRLISTSYRRKIGMLERTLRLSAGS